MRTSLPGAFGYCPRIAAPHVRGRFEMRIGASPSTGLGAGCWVVPWSWSGRTMKRSRLHAGPSPELPCGGSA